MTWTVIFGEWAVDTYYLRFRIELRGLCVE